MPEHILAALRDAISTGDAGMLRRTFTRSSRVTFALCLALASSSASIACGDDGAQEGSAGSSTANNGVSGSRATGGTGSGGKAISAGSPAAQGGLSGFGGDGAEAGTGGGNTVEPGGPCTENCPKGNVASCYDDCPLGACDNETFFASTTCSSLYPAPVDDETVWCAKGVSASYCLTVINADIDSYVVTCDKGMPEFHQCDHGCRTINNEPSCND